MQGRREAGGVENDALPYLDGGGAVVEAEDDERHVTTIEVTRRIVRDGPGQYKFSRRNRPGTVRYSGAMRVPTVCALAIALGIAGSPAAVLSAPACRPGEVAAQVMVAELGLARGAYAASAEAYACAAVASADPALAERATRIAFDQHQWQPALTAARRWVALEPEREEARRYLATTLLRLHRADEAAAEFAVVLESTYAGSAEGYEALLGVLSAESNDTGAARVMEQLAAARPDLAEAHYARSVLWHKAEHGERALDAAQRAVALRPDWSMAALAEVRALLLLGRVDEGLDKARQAAAGGDELAALNFAWLLAGAGREDEAAAEFESLRRLRGGAAPALEGLGTLAYSRGDLEAAERYFSELAQAARGSDSALAFLGLIADRKDDPALAIRYLERVTSGPRALASQLRAHELLIESGAAERAELLLDDFLAASPDSTRDLVVRLASRHAAAGRGDDALALLDRLMSTYPDDDDLRLARAFLFERLDRVPEAVADMREVLRRRPDDPTALNSLGYTLVDRTARTAEGQALLQRAIELRPDSYAIIDSVGWALYRRGRLVEARDWLERAWARSQDPEVAAHLGEVLWALDERDAARLLWEHALQESPDNLTLQRTLERHPG